MMAPMARVVIVTGCASGIGRALAKKLYERGDSLLVTDVNESGLRAAAEADGLRDVDRVSVQRLDVRDAAAWDAAVRFAVQRWGRLDVLCNVAGYLVPVWARDARAEDVDRTMDVNAKGLMHGTNAAVRQMVAQGHGHVINVASIAGLIPVPGLAIYSASKHAARAYSIAVGQEVREAGVFVTAVCPAVVATPMMDIQIDREEATFVFSGSRALTTDEVVGAIVDRAMVRKPLELVLDVPGTGQGLLAKVGNVAPGLAFRLRERVAKAGRRQQQKLRKAQGPGGR
jgi:3-oxoacyl-[acyl-carrier protein] reductase